MLRTVGLCVIVISGVGCGFAMSNELGRRKKMMEMILRMIILLRGEIRMEINLCTMPLQVLPGNWKGSTENFLYLRHRK